ncbi:MAG TPA: hypothetical protein VN657_02335 [Nitrospiraceae bacterium]|nr:hypothetical protein [Nitrospiraceae bacterium]
MLLPAHEGIDTTMSNQGQSTTNPPHLPFHAYANIGDEDNLISVKRFATRHEAAAWIVQLEVGRPGYYTIIRSLTVRHSHTTA